MAKTRQEIREKVQLELDLLSTSGSYVKGSGFITPAEINGHISDSVKLVASYIHNLYEDYYFTIGSISLVAGTSEYPLPANMYVNKIRRLLYDNNSDKYKINRLHNIDEIPYITSADYYRYRLVNNGLTEVVKLYPNAKATEANVVQVYYYRRPKELALDADVLDIPEEFDNVVVSDVKFRCLSKEPDNPSLQIVKTMRDEQIGQMLATLGKRVPDDTTDIRPDMSFYDESIA